MKPIIGVTCYYVYSYMPKLDRGGADEMEQYKIIIGTYAGKALYKFNSIPFNLAFQTDIEAVEIAGGIPLVIPYLENKEDLNEIIDMLDGIVFTGGFDVDPNIYGEENKYLEGLVGSLEGLDDKDGGLFSKIIGERDYQELYLARKILNEKKIPVLGICRGAQMLNVSMGGTLYQDIYKQRREFTLNHGSSGKLDDYSHEVHIEEGSDLEAILEKKTIAVNSIHHQAIKDLGENFIAAAKAEDGIVEAIEFKDKERFVLGVQWHPEMLGKKDAIQLKLLKGFINKAIEYKREKK